MAAVAPMREAGCLQAPRTRVALQLRPPGCVFSQLAHAYRKPLVTPCQASSGSGLPGPSDGEEARGSVDLLEAACPVPTDQQPMREFMQLQEAFLFDWANLPLPEFALRLFGVFAGFFVTIGLPVSAVTFSLEDELLQVIAASSIGSGFITLVIVLRLYLGYSHVNSRLLSATVEYEETGWYDGQVWVKTPQMLMRDRLLGTYQVKPTLEKLKRTMLGMSGAMAVAVAVLLALPPPKAYSSGSPADYALPTSFPARSEAALTTSPSGGEDTYWQRVATYEPWALDEEEEGGVEGGSVARGSLLDHLQRTQP